LTALRKPVLDCRSCTSSDIALEHVQAFNNTIYDSLVVAACVLGLKV